MIEQPANKINIFLTVDLKTINSYFNKHDPSPLYKRQLSYRFEEYITASVAQARRFSVIFYKLKCTSEIDKQYAEPLMYAIRRHFEKKTAIRIGEFARFKRKTFILLILSLTGIIVTHGLLPLFMNTNNHLESIIMTSCEVLSWVILWRPIDRLIFDWNPHLKEIAILNKLATAEMMIAEIKTDSSKKTNSVLFPISQAG